MLLYAEGEIRPVLQAAPPVDRAAARALVERLYPAHRIAQVEDGTLFEQANPPDYHVYAGCFPGLAVSGPATARCDVPSACHRAPGSSRTRAPLWTSRVPSGPGSARSRPRVSTRGRTRCRFTLWNSPKRHCAPFSASTTRAFTTTTIPTLRTLCSPASPCIPCTDRRSRKPAGGAHNALTVRGPGLDALRAGAHP